MDTERDDPKERKFISQQTENYSDDEDEKNDDDNDSGSSSSGESNASNPFVVVRDEQGIGATGIRPAPLPRDENIFVQDNKGQLFSMQPNDNGQDQQPTNITSVPEASQPPPPTTTAPLDPKQEFDRKIELLWILKRLRTPDSNVPMLKMSDELWKIESAVHQLRKEKDCANGVETMRYGIVFASRLIETAAERPPINKYVKLTGWSRKLIFDLESDKRYDEALIGLVEKYGKRFPTNSPEFQLGFLLLQSAVSYSMASKIVESGGLEPTTPTVPLPPPPPLAATNTTTTPATPVPQTPQKPSQFQSQQPLSNAQILNDQQFQAILQQLKTSSAQQGQQPEESSKKRKHSKSRTSSSSSSASSSGSSETMSMSVASERSVSREVQPSSSHRRKRSRHTESISSFSSSSSSSFVTENSSLSSESEEEEEPQPIKNTKTMKGRPKKMMPLKKPMPMIQRKKPTPLLPPKPIITTTTTTTTNPVPIIPIKLPSVPRSVSSKGSIRGSPIKEKKDDIVISGIL